MSSQFSSEIKSFNLFLNNYYNRVLTVDGSLDIIAESIKYSLNSGGKRYRPLLSLATAQWLGVQEEKVLPLALAVESIHTYSLIHDDLPCMDDDDFRRGQPTNHKKFGEDIALLAGDALISEALLILVKNYSSMSGFTQFFTEFANSIGVNGMVGGQVLDLKLKSPTQAQMQLIHKLKTGQLIKLAIKGVGYIADCETSTLSLLDDLSLKLGLAFQLADDIHDFEQAGSSEEANMANVIGLSTVKKQLQEISQDIFEKLEPYSQQTEFLKKLIQFNLQRKE